MHQFVNKNYKQIIGLFSHFVTPSILNQEEGARLYFLEKVQPEMNESHFQ